VNPEQLLALRDQAGVPSHPILFLTLGVLTFALHIAAVQVMLGASGLTLWGAFSADLRWRRLAPLMLTTAKVAVSVAIVLGVAPLLFVQVTYDPFWYTSNVLSAWWVIAFIVLLIAGYMAIYFFYWRNPMGSDQPARSRGWMVAAILLLLSVGFIVHTLSYQMLFPERWMAWYAPQGRVDPSGTGLHAFHLPRFLFFIALSVPVVGAWLLALRRYLQVRPQEDPAFLQFLATLSARLRVPGGVIALVLGAWWMLTLPQKMAGFAGSPWVWLAVVALLATVVLPHLLGPQLDKGLWGYATFGLGAVALILVGVARELLRYRTLMGVHGYDPLGYRIQMDWYSTLTFFLTFGVLGTVTLGYMITVAWRAGQVEGVYTPSPAIARLGRWATWLIALWILHYFVLGFITWGH